MATTPRDGSGTTITFGTSGFSADVLSIDGPSGVRVAIDTTVLADLTEMSFIPAKLIDLGELTLEIEHEGSQDWILDNALEVITIDWSGVGVGAKWSLNGFVTAYTPTAAIGERMQASITIKLSGALTIS